MENEYIQKMIGLSRRMDGAKSTPPTRVQQPMPPRQQMPMVNPNQGQLDARIARADAQIAQLDEAVYGPSKVQEGVYDAWADMESMKQPNGMPIDVTNSKLPKPILESIMANPCDYQTVIPSEVDSYMSNFAQATQGAGVKKMLAMNETLNGPAQAPRQVIRESQAPSQSKGVSMGAGIDYTMLGTLIRGVIDEKFQEFKNDILDDLTENHSCQYLMLKDNKLFFIAKDGAMYECTMKRVGKVNIKI